MGRQLVKGCWLQPATLGLGTHSAERHDRGVGEENSLSGDFLMNASESQTPTQVST